MFVLNILAFFLISGAYLIYLPLLMETRLNSTSFTIGLIMSLASITMAIVSASIGKINRISGYKRMIIIGTVFYFASMTLFSVSASYWFIVLPALLCGIAQGMVLPTIQTLLVEYAPFQQRAAFMSINSMVLRIGQTAGPVVIGFAFALGGIQYTFLGGSIVAFVMLGIVVGMVRK